MIHYSRTPGFLAAAAFTLEKIASEVVAIRVLIDERYDERLAAAANVVVGGD